MSKGRDILFEALTPLGFVVRVTRDYWNIIITVKHPVMAGCEAEVRAALESPEEIRVSKSDEKVYLFYRSRRTGRWVCAVSKQEGPEGFLITAYPTDAIKEGKKNMAEVNIYYDPTGRTLTVWFGRPQAEYTCEETGDEVILMKDRKGRVIGFERLNYPTKSAQPLRMAFETISQPA